MNKKLIPLFLTLSLMLSNIIPAYAADGKLSIAVDCDTLNKDVNVGFISNPADPDNGEEVIAYNIILTLIPLGTTQLSDLNQVQFVKNDAYDMIVAQVTSEEIEGNREIKIAGGFLNQKGMNNVADLLKIEGLNQKNVKIEVKKAELFSKANNDDLYRSDPAQSFNIDAGACQTLQDTSTSTEDQGETSIVLTSNVNNASPGDEVIITATITNVGTNSIDWSQTKGEQITPTIKNTETSPGITLSTLKYMTGTPATDTIIELSVGAAKESITINGSDTATTAAADTQGTTDSTTSSSTLQQRLLERQNTTPTEPSGTIHDTAGAALTRSGPEHTAALLLISALILLGYRKVKKTDLARD